MRAHIFRHVPPPNGRREGRTVNVPLPPIIARASVLAATVIPPTPPKIPIRSLSFICMNTSICGMTNSVRRRHVLEKHQAHLRIASTSHCAPRSNVSSESASFDRISRSYASNFLQSSCPGRIFSLLEMQPSHPHSQRREIPSIDLLDRNTVAIEFLNDSSIHSSSSLS